MHFTSGNPQLLSPAIEQVLYVDGDEEILNLKKERWEFVEDSLSSDVSIILMLVLLSIAPFVLSPDVFLLTGANS